MEFKLSYSLNGMTIDRDGELPRTLRVSETSRFELWLRSTQQHRKTERQICCDLIMEVTPPPRVTETLSALEKGKLLFDDPIQEGIPYSTLTECVVDASGNIAANWIIPFRLLPEGAKPWLREIEQSMSAYLSAFIKLLRWTQRASAKHRSYSTIGFYWSSDGKIWNHFPMDTSGRLLQSSPIRLSDKYLNDLSAMITEEVREPLSHDVMREAQDLCHQAPRSALLIAFAALETGVKEILTLLIPGATILFEKLPSPPLLTIFQEVIPDALKFAGREPQYLPLKKNEMDFLRKWVSQRNQVSHGTKHVVDGETVEDFIIFATDILYLLDINSGREWAANKLQHSIWSEVE